MNQEDNKTPNDASNDASNDNGGGRPATVEEQNNISNILEMLRQQNLGAATNSGNGLQVESVSLNRKGPTTTITPTTAGNLIAENDTYEGDASNLSKRHAFWDTQPMFLEKPPDASENSTLELHAPLIPNKSKSEIRATPYNMPKGFVWCDVDITNESDKQQVYDLLAKNYVEDDDCMFRFDYSIPFLEWALTPPNYPPSWHVGVRSASSKKLVAFISAVPANVRSYTSKFPCVEINFLCVHKKLRSKRLAPVLIKEITRRVNMSGGFQAVYTAGVVLPGPVSSCRYYHRSIEVKKLIEIGFTRVQPRMTMARMIKLYKVQPDRLTTPNLRPMTADDVESAHALLCQHLKKFQLVIDFDKDDFAHWLLPRDNVITSYVACNDKDDPKKVTDMISFYHLHSSIIGHEKHDNLRAAYSYYNVATTVKFVDLMNDALSLAKRENIDVFNALEQMENGSIFKALKFGKGDGCLNYYLYNWCCPTMESKDVGIVLL